MRANNQQRGARVEVATAMVYSGPEALQMMAQFDGDDEGRACREQEGNSECNKEAGRREREGLLPNRDDIYVHRT